MEWRSPHRIVSPGHGETLNRRHRGSLRGKTRMAPNNITQSNTTIYKWRWRQSPANPSLPNSLCSAKTLSPFRQRWEQAGNRDEAHSEPAWKPSFYPPPNGAVSLARVWADNLLALEPPAPMMNAACIGCNKTPTPQGLSSGDFP